MSQEESRVEIKTVDPEDPMYDVLSAALRHGNRTAAKTDYNILAAQYNAAPVGAVILATLKNPKISNLEKVLANRGIFRNTDYTMTRAKYDAEDGSRPVIIQRLTDSVVRLV